MIPFSVNPFCPFLPPLGKEGQENSYKIKKAAKVAADDVTPKEPRPTLAVNHGPILRLINQISSEQTPTFLAATTTIRSMLLIYSLFTPLFTLQCSITIFFAPVKYF